MIKDVRWKQRFDNLNRAFLFLEKSVAMEKYDELQAAGLVQSFEFTFELSWKTLKDYMNEKGGVEKFPRDVIKAAFEAGLIEDGHIWIDMLEKRNILTHTYNDAQAAEAIRLIKELFFPALQQVYQTMSQLAGEEN